MDALRRKGVEPRQNTDNTRIAPKPVAGKLTQE